MKYIIAAIIIYMVLQLGLSLISFWRDKNDKFDKYRGDHY